MTNETIADIIAEKRRQADNIEREMFGIGLVAEIRRDADRIEAARKRERGNSAALRNALNLCVDEMCARCRDLASARGNPLPCLQGCEPVRKAKAALSVPPRNCDVGTASEQEDRFAKYCRGSNYCAVCPIRKSWDFKNGRRPSCAILWAQMPYEKGGAK